MVMPSTESTLTRGLSKDEANALMALGTPVTAPTGKVLFQMGSVADNLFVVARGRVTLTLPMQVRGSEEDVVIEEKLPGETFGWSALIAPHRFTLKATASVDTELIAFAQTALFDHLADYPAVGFKVIQNVASVVGHRLNVFQTMWLREMQRVIELRCS
jgi:CRP-like cAMP-binding protein